MGQLGRRVSDAFPSPEVLGDTSKGEQNLLTLKYFMGLLVRAAPKRERKNVLN